MPFPAKPAEVDIVNMALGLLKCRKIASMSENSVEAVAANEYWDPARRLTLAGHDWEFALAVKLMALSSTYPTQGPNNLYAARWIYAYAAPSNAVAVWHVYNEATIDKSVGEDFRSVYDDTNNQLIILTNCVDAYGEYTFDLSDTTLWSPTFIDAFSYVLAGKMAPQLTGDDSIGDSLIKKGLIATSEAERMSSYESQITEVKSSSYEDAR
jgi:hypothetical protein